MTQNHVTRRFKLSETFSVKHKKPEKCGQNAQNKGCILCSDPWNCETTPLRVGQNTANETRLLTHSQSHDLKPSHDI